MEGCRDARQAALQLLPFVGPGWYPKVSIAAMLETGVCRWDHIPLGIYARGHVGAATLRRALERMDAAWPEGEEHMAKLSVNAMIGLWARRADVIYSVRSSSCQLDGPGADFTQSFCYGEGSVWDFVYTRRLLTNGTYRPIHDAVLGFEHCMVAKARRLLAAPPQYVKQVKTDCLLLQGLPKSRQESLEALTRLRHQDGTPVFRVEECKPLLGRSAPPRMEAERPALRRWREVEDPLEHCAAGNSLLLTGLPGTGKTYLARKIVARLREQGEAVHLVSKTHCSAQNLGLGAQTADHWVRRYVRNGSVQKLDWLVVEEITQLDMALWADLACVGLNPGVKFLLLGDFRQLPAVLDSWAGQPISAPLEHSQLVLDLAGGHRHELTENMRSDPGIFDFVKWLQVGEPDAPALEEAKARARELFPAKPGWPETTLVISHARRVAVNAAANRALQPPGAKLLVLETGVEIALPESQLQSPQNRAQNSRGSG